VGAVDVMPRFQDIPRFTRSAGYMVNVGFAYLVKYYAQCVVDYNLDVSPDFQRAHVWTSAQKVRFVEYVLRGGTSGLDIYTNCPDWNRVKDPRSQMVLIDGKQRLHAVLAFLNNELPAFGARFREYTDSPSITTSNFRWHVNDLGTRAEELQWYLDLNSGGVVHTADELDKVRGLLEEGVPYVAPSLEALVARAGEGCDVVQEELARQLAEKHRLELCRAELAARPPPIAPPKKKTRSRF